MIKSAVTLALVPEIKTGPWIFWHKLEENIARAALLGFDGVELFAASAQALDPVKLGDLLAKYNLELAALGTGAGKVIQGLTLTHSSASIREKAQQYILDMMELGARFKAPVIIGSMQGTIAPGDSREEALAWLTEGLNILGKEAKRLGVPLIYEPLNRYETNLVNTLGEGAEILKSLETTQVKLLADLFHMNIEEVSLAGSIREFGSFIGHVHFADSNRRPMGLGHTAMPEIVATLSDIKYQGFVSAEAFPYPTPAEAAAQTMKAFKQFFRNSNN